MATNPGRTIPLSLNRRVICDLMDASMNVPLVRIQKTINVQELITARKEAQPRPSWCSIFTKAYGKVVASQPELRRAYLGFPWARLFEFEKNVADIAVEARVLNETAVIMVPVNRPETRTLLGIDQKIAEGRDNPLENVPRCGRALAVARFPRFMRRWIWWLTLNMSGNSRSKVFGTFGVTSVGNLGVDSLSPLTPTTTLLHYGAIDPNGDIVLRLTFDHRVMDGTTPSLALCEMERLLKTEILEELRSLRPADTCVRPTLLAA
ncbi:MAG: hypothetical protein EXS16_15740 [Gemmataceae bacterium]|nr:hypothetical protein [Gemmataceae bacterium]